MKDKKYAILRLRSRTHDRLKILAEIQDKSIIDLIDELTDFMDQYILKQEKETDIMGVTSVVRALGLNNASRKRFSEMAQRAAAAGYVQRKKSGNAGAAAAVWAEEAAKAKARDHWKMLQAAVVGDRPAKAVKSARHTT